MQSTQNKSNNVPQKNVFDKRSKSIAIILPNCLLIGMNIFTIFAFKTEEY